MEQPASSKRDDDAAGQVPDLLRGRDRPVLRVQPGRPESRARRISILSNEGKLLASIGTTPAAGTGPGQFLSPHGLAVDSRGDLYVGEVAYTAWRNLFPGQPVPARLRSLQKFERVARESSTPGAERLPLASG